MLSKATDVPAIGPLGATGDEPARGGSSQLVDPAAADRTLDAIDDRIRQLGRVPLAVAREASARTLRVCDAADI